MALKNLESLNENLLGLFIYSTNPTIDLLARDCIKNQFTKGKECIIDARNAKELMLAKSDAMVSPLIGGKYVIHVNIDKMSRKEIIVAINTHSHYGITVYWTTRYNLFKEYTNLEYVKKMSNYFNSFYLNRLTYHDVLWLHDKMLGTEKEYLPYALKVYVGETYRWDSVAVCELFRLLKAGYKVETKKDIIRLVGVGGNSVDKLCIQLLTSTTATLKGKELLTRKVLALVEDLHSTLDHKQIYNYMLAFLNGCIEMKQLQLLGYYADPYRVMPEGFDEKRLARLGRFEATILNEISLPRILNFKICLTQHRSRDKELDLMQGLLSYIALLDGSGVSKKSFKRKR